MDIKIPEADVLVAKCRKSGDAFGIRVEKRSGDWVMTWAFKTKEKEAKNEGYGKTELSGSFQADEEYPGCPYCHATGIFKCGNCGGTSCYYNDTVVTCHWCGRKAEDISA